MKYEHQAQGFLRFGLFSRFENQGRLVAAYTTRRGVGGKSSTPFDRMNVGYNTADDRENVLFNIKAALEHLKLSERQAVLTNQVHGDHIAVFRRGEDEQLQMQGRRENDLLFLDNCDGVVTNRSDLALLTFYADCTAIMVYDPIKQVIGMAHSGWKGTVLRIGEKLIDTMTAEFDCQPETLLCAIGPTALSCCYEVDEVVKTAVEKAGLSFVDHALPRLTPYEGIDVGDGERFLLNMETLNREVLLQAGILPEHIELSGFCTMCHPDLFYSYRRDGSRSGRMSAMMGLVSD